MALNDIKVPKENAQGTFDEITLPDATTSVRGLLTSADKTKLNGIAAGAEVNVQANWTEADSGSDAFILNKPSTFAPTAHAASHASAGSDPLFDQDLNTTDSPSFESVSVNGGGITIAANDENKIVGDSGGIIDFDNVGISGFGIATSDGNFSASSFSIRNITDDTKRVYFDASNVSTGTDRTVTFPNKNITLDDAGDARTPSSHTHGNLTNDGKLGTTAGLPVVTTTAGAVTTLALGTANQVLRVNSGATGVEFADPAASGVTGAAASASDVLGVSGANITGVDASADRIVFWDDSAGKLTHLTVGSGLSISDTTISATATGTIGGSTGATDNAVLRADGVGGSTSQSSDISIEDATTTTANNVTISNQHSGQTNSSLVLSPKGTGSLSASKPNGAASGGNARGANATDWQTLRTTATQVASGTGSVIIGGDRNTSSGTCTVAGGENCTASGTYSIALGRTNSANTGAANAVVGGQDNNASGRESFIAAGNRNTASAGCCAIFSGDDTTLDRPYMVGHSGGRFAAGGDSQSIHVNLRAKTTTNSAVELKVGGYAVTSQTITIPAGKVISGIVNIHGVKSDGSAVAHYIRQFSYKRVGATSTLVGTATIGTDIAAGTSITFNDPDTNGDAISISVTGVASETWRWTAHISAVETAYGT